MKMSKLFYKTFEIPKSPIFKFPEDVKNIFPHLRSLCKILF